MFDIFLLGGLIGSLAFFIPTRLDGDELFSFYALGFISILSFFFHPVRKLSTKCLGLVLAFAMISTLLNFQFPVRSVFVNLFIGCFALKVMAERTELNAKKLGWVLSAYTLVEIAYLILQHFKMDHYYGAVYEELAGTFLNPWMMGCGAVIFIPFVFAVHPALCLLIFPLLILSKSWTCLILGVGLFGYLLPPFKEKFKFCIAVVLFAIDYLLFFGHHFDTSRLFCWIDSFQYLHHQWYGNGIGSWAHEGFLLRNGHDNYHWRWAHNEFYQHFFEQGRIGALIMAGVVLGMINVKSKPIKAAVLGIIGLSFAHPVFHFGRLIFLILTVLALSMAERGIPWPRIKSA